MISLIQESKILILEKSQITMISLNQKFRYWTKILNDQDILRSENGHPMVNLDWIATFYTMYQAIVTFAFSFNQFFCQFFITF